MAINLDASRPASAAPVRIERQESDARQHRWMFEMEKAMFASGAKPDTTMRSADDSPSAAPHVGPTDALAHKATSAASLRKDQGSKPVGTPQARSDSGADAGHSAPVDGRAGSTVNAATPASAATPPANSAPTVGTAASTASIKSISSTSAVLRPPAQRVVAALASANGIAMRGAGVSSPVLAAQASEALHTPGPVAPLLAERAAISLAAFTGAGSVDEASATEAAHAPDLAPELGEAPTFEERLLHVYLANDGVHAYIRDAGLEGAQLQAVAQALAGELAASGQQLAAVTINGKAVEARMAPPGQDDDLFSLPGDGHDAAPPTFFSSTPVRKGNT